MKINLRPKRLIYLTLQGVGLIIDIPLKRHFNTLSKLFNKLARHYSTEESTEEQNIAPAKTWLMTIDEPSTNKQNIKMVHLSGWFLPNVAYKNVALRLKTPDKRIIKIYYGVKRVDVADMMIQTFQTKISPNCGFKTTFKMKEDGEYTIEAKLDESKWRSIEALNLFFDPEYLPRDLMVPALSEKYAEHINAIESKSKYFFEEKNKNSFKLHEFDPKLIAFYLPQFHPIAENNKWWGEGFTEWTNVTTATPGFIGHEQPKLPSDLGFYDLRNEQNIYQQIELAKQYGIYGFCLYYYWFSGKKLLEKPLDSILKNKDWDFNFMICWANENWTRRWDGHHKDVLIQQEYKDGDALKFIMDVEDILLDPRYIRKDNRPVLLVYRAENLAEPFKYISTWRSYFSNKHGIELYILSIQGIEYSDGRIMGFDSSILFNPLSIKSQTQKTIPKYSIESKKIDNRFNGTVFDYRKVALNIAGHTSPFPAYQSIMPAWDNAARRKNGQSTTFFNSNPDIYGTWLKNILELNQQKNSSFSNEYVFINAWNEWAEGAYLEPDLMYGHAYLNRTAEVLAKYSKNLVNKSNFPLYGIEKQKNVKMAVVIHMYYADLWPTFKKKLNSLNFMEYDLFITIPLKNKDLKDKIIKFRNDAHIITVPNRGRDVLAFMHIARRLEEQGYKYVLKLHSKKSLHRMDGNEWLNEVIDRLIPKNAESAEGLIKLLNKNTTGIIGPEGHYVSLSTYFGSNIENIRKILNRIVGPKKSSSIINHPEEFGFFAGTMFWARLDAIKPLLDQHFFSNDFQSESGQIDGTFAHALERLFCLIPEAQSKNLYIMNGTTISMIENGVAGKYKFV